LFHKRHIACCEVQQQQHAQGIGEQSHNSTRPRGATGATVGYRCHERLGASLWKAARLLVVFFARTVWTNKTFFRSKFLYTALFIRIFPENPKNVHPRLSIRANPQSFLTLPYCLKHRSKSLAKERG